MSKRYAYAKVTLPTEWAEKTASDIKIEIKNYMLESVLKKRKESLIWEHIDRMLGEFYEEFDETERQAADGFRSELSDFAREAYQLIRKSIGNLSPALFVAAVADPKTVPQRTKESIGKAAAFDFSTSPDVAGRIVAEAAKYPTGAAYSRATAAETYYRDVHKQVKSFMNDEWLKLSKAKNYGTSVNPRNIAEMSVRFKKYEAEKEDLKRQGVKLVFVPPHSNCSLRCQPYQGRVYSLDGSTGTIDGRRYIPIEDAAENVTVRSKGGSGRAYYAGLFSYNCRHTMKPYVKGQNIEKIPRSVIDREREIEARQRYLERQIRLYKEKEQIYRTLHKASPNADILRTAREARKKARDLTEQYEAFSEKNGVPFFRERTRIVAGEDIYKRTQGRNDPVLIKN